MQCDTPMMITPKGWFDPVAVPCGRCPNCKKRRVNSWVFRLKQEEKVSTSSHFVTLTYDTKFVPISDNGFLTLNKRDIQLFFKRLRKLTSNNIKYYICGEYGSKNHRPHYHAIIFNVPNTQLYVDAWKIDGVQIGSIHIGKVESDSIAYTMKYIDKSVYRPKHGRDDRVPEFALMSKHLGINYLSDEIIKYHKADSNNRLYVNNGEHKIAMPKYYRHKIFNKDEMKQQVRHIQALQPQRLDDLRSKYEQQYGKNNIYFSFDDWLDNQKLGRYINFHNTLKDRKL